jgi:hypothetical protein
MPNLKVFFDASYELSSDELRHPGSAAARALIPMDSQIAASQVLFFGGKRGSGKTYAAGKLTEELLTDGVQVIVIDVVGNWWGLRAGADGDGEEGFTIPVIGGDHGDIPVYAEGGADVARMLVETESSAVLDLSSLRKGARQRFITDWAEEFFHLKKSHHSPVHVVLEETHTIAPQRVIKGQERMLGAITDIVRLGRNYGIGVSMLDQRPQSVDKEILHQAEVLCAFQFTGAHERDAIRRWAEAKELSAVKAAFKDLSSLPRGRCILWSPEWLKFCGPVDVGVKQTLDASATPTGRTGLLTREIGTPMRPIDLGELEEAMLRAAKKEKPTAPAESRMGVLTAPAQTTHSKRYEVADAPADIGALDLALERAKADIARLTDEAERLRERVDNLGAERQHDLVIIWPLVRDALERISSEAGKVSELVRDRLANLQKGMAISSPKYQGTFVVPVRENPSPSYRMEIGPQILTRDDSDAVKVIHGHGPGEKMSKVERTILVTLAQHGGRLRKGKVLALAGYAASGDTAKAFASHLQRGWIEDADGELAITSTGKSAIGEWTALPQGEALYKSLLTRKGVHEVDRRILAAIWSCGSEGATKKKILEIAKYAASGDTAKSFARWIRLGYVRMDGSKVIPSENLYDH